MGVKKNPSENNEKKGLIFHIVFSIDTCKSINNKLVHTATTAWQLLNCV